MANRHFDEPSDPDPSDRPIEAYLFSSFLWE